jgi:membrane peptidoglycan carboxypeptidase
LPLLAKVAKSGTTDGWKDIWTMGYTTDIAIGVWVGNTSASGESPARLREFDGIQGAGPIWQKMMLEVHQPQWADLIDGPDGDPMPRDFPRPGEVYDGQVCDATGNQATPGFSSHREVLVESAGPYLPCDQLSAYQKRELEKAVEDLSRNNKWTNGAQDKIRRYERAATGGGDMRIEEIDSDDSEDFSEDEEPPIEPLN